MNINSLVVLLLVGAAIPAQTPDDSKPSITNLMNSEYPRVYPDGRTVFRLKAPNASKVQLAGAIAAAPLDMSKGDDGFWSVTNPPAAPGFH